jgi:radical SAM superfamily enzyme YgiQ (UPF0313 family)
MKVQLISGLPIEKRKGGEIDTLYPPLGLLYLVSYCRQFVDGIEWKVTDGDMLAFEKTLKEIRKFRPDVIGFSLHSMGVFGAYKLINQVKKEFPETFIIVGGVHATALPNETLQMTKADVVIVGEGEQTFYISSRGCPYQCIFCSNPVWNHSLPKLRLRSPKNILDEVELLVNEYRMKELYDQCDEFNANPMWAEKVCDEFIARDLGVNWKVQMRADKITEEFARKLVKSGCWLVTLGIESGNQETLNGVRKFVSLDQVIKSCQILKKHNIKVFGLFMAFNAWEEKGKLRYEGVKETKNTLKFAKSLIDKNLLDYISWSLTAPFPGSKLYEIGIKHKIIPQEVLDGREDWNNTWRLLLNLPGVSREDWESIKNEGSKLQARCLLKNGDMNRSLIPLYFKRGFQISKLTLKKVLGRY